MGSGTSKSCSDSHYNVIPQVGSAINRFSAFLYSQRHNLLSWEFCVNAIKVGRLMVLVYCFYTFACIVHGVTTRARELAMLTATESATQAGHQLGYILIRKWFYGSHDSTDSVNLQGTSFKDNLAEIPRAISLLTMRDTSGLLGSCVFLAAQTLCRRRFQL